METMDRGLKTRMDKEIYLMLHSRFAMRDILRMSKERLDWWVATTMYMMEEAESRSGARTA